jgi:hypothetical protein
MRKKITLTNITDDRESEIIKNMYKCIVKYRFTDDPEDMVREHVPTWKAEYGALELVPAFPGKSIILL